MQSTLSGLTHNAILDASPIPTSVVDREGTIVYVNDAFLLHTSKVRGSEIRREDRVGRNVLDFITDTSEHDRQRWLAFYDRVLKKGEPVFLEECCERPSPGHEMYMDVRMNPIKGEDGRLVAAMVTWQDVTERVRAQKEERRRAALDRVRVSVYEMREGTDIQNVLVSLYEALKDVGVDFDNCSVQLLDEEKGIIEHSGFDRDRGQVTIRRPVSDNAVYEAFHDKRPVYRRNLDEEDRYEETIGIRATSGKDTRSVLDVPFSHGTIAINSVRPDAFSESDIETLQEFAGVLSDAYTRFDDIQRIEESEEALRQSEERYRSLFEHMGAAIALEQKDIIAMVNARFEELTGYGKEEVEGRMSYLDFICEEEQARIQKYHEGRAWGEAVPSRYEVPVRRKDGERRWVDVSVHLVPRTRHRITTLIDVTERKDAEERILRQERLSAVGQLAAGIAHDFNNLLTGIIGYAQLLGRRADLPESAKGDLKRVEEEGLRAAHLVRQILDFSRKSMIQRTPLDLTSLLEESIKFLKRTIPENVDIALEMGSGAYIVHADPAQMQQVVTNLAVNARDAMPEGGKLKFRLSRFTLEPGEHPPVPEMSPGEWVLLSVSDTGAGIPAKVKPRIFEPFFTTRDPTRGHGTGLGLSQVYGIVMQHEGFVDVRSEVGEGTTLVIYLPALSVPEEVSGEEPSEEYPRGGGETILVVEDDSVVREMMGMMLEELGYRVFTAASSREALDVYDRHGEEIVLVLTDMVMPGMGGVRLFHALRERDPEVKVVVMTGYSLGQEEKEFASQGVSGWVQKPITLSTLSRVMDDVLA